MAAAQVDHLRPKIELSRGSRHIETIGAQNLLWPSVYCISYSVGFITPCNTTCGTSRSSKLSEGAPQHDAKAGQIVVLGELSPIAVAALLLLQRRVKRARQRVGSQTLDQAGRSRNKRLAFGGPFYLVLPENASEELWPVRKVLHCRL
jgi:hypothetical protein